MTAWHLANKCPDLVDVTLLEASPRLGGKLLTRRFPESGVLYEAGVAEIYDYSAIGPDPLIDLIHDLGLATVPMDSESVVMGGRILPDLAAVERAFGAATRQDIERFRSFCAREISPLGYYESVSKEDNARSYARLSGQRLLQQEVRDHTARTYLKVAAHSDIAAPLHLTTGLNTVKNVLMDVDGYIALCSITGGIERLTETLAAAIVERRAAQVCLDTYVTRVGVSETGRYRITTLQAGHTEVREFDLLFLALPLSWLSLLQWEGPDLDRAMAAHVAHFDRPGHYLRVSALFEKPFWREAIPGSWWMSDAFNGCCVYDEGARHDVGGHGVLGWLIAGNAALAMANLDDPTLVARALDSLPKELQHGRSLLRESAVHRWLSSVNAVPGGFPCRDVRTNHLPEPKLHPGLLLVGDYVFDSTLNGVLDSADAATDMALGRIVRLHEERSPARSGGAKARSRTGGGSGADDPSRALSFDPRSIERLARIAWDLPAGFSILDAGSADGVTLGALRGLGLEAWGIEKNAGLHRRTPEGMRPFNHLGDATALPFPDNHFDVVHETCLAHLSNAKIDKALAEFHRVARKGVIFGSVTSETAVAALGRHDVLRSIRQLGTWWEWSERFFEHGFDLALDEPDRLAAAWRIALEQGPGLAQWFGDEDSLRYCLYSRAES
jgi:monoamine oxidase/SAM-dependent methyltransferase